MIAIISVDVFLARKAHHHIVRNDGFFEEFLENFKVSEDTSRAYCDIRKIYTVYLYQICFINDSKGHPSRGPISFIYHRPMAVVLRLIGSSDYYFSEYRLGVTPKVINKDFIVIYENTGWD